MTADHAPFVSGGGDGRSGGGSPGPESAPGSAAAPPPPAAVRTLALLAAVLALAFPVFLWKAGDREVCDIIDERVAVTAREMWRADEWIVPTMNGEPRLQKPPLAYWLPQALAELRGEFDETTLWLPFGLAAVGCLFFTFGIGTVIAGERAGLMAALVLLMAPIFTKGGTTASADVLLLLWTSGAWFFHLLGRGGRRPGAAALGFYACAGLGALAKGPTILVCTVLPILIEAAFTRSAAPLRPLRSVPGVVLFLLLAFAWPVLLYLRLEGAPGGLPPVRQWILETFGKMVASEGVEEGYKYLKHPEPWHFYIARLVPFFGFWGPALILALIRDGLRLAGRLAEKPMVRDAWTPVRAWFLTGLLFFSFILEKKGLYILPLAPAGALLVASVLEEAHAVLRAKLRPVAWALAGAAAAAVALFTAAAFAPALVEAASSLAGKNGDALARLFLEKSGLFIFIAAVLLAGALTLPAALGRPSPLPAVAAVAITFAAVAVPWRALALELQRSEWVGEGARAARSLLRPDQPVYGADRLPAGLLYYLDRRILPVDLEAPGGIGGLPRGACLLISQASLERRGIPFAGNGEPLLAGGVLEGLAPVMVINPAAASAREKVFVLEKRS